MPIHLWARLIGDIMFYTYLWLRDDGTPYYVGKGIKRRPFRKSSPSKDRIILQEWDLECEAFEAEKFLISFYGRKDRDTGCLRNLTDGGEGTVGWIPSQSFREKQSKIHKGVKKSPWTEERKKAQSDARQGWKLQESALPASLKARIGRKVPESWKLNIKKALIGHVVSEETRKKISDRKRYRDRFKKSLLAAIARWERYGDESAGTTYPFSFSYS